MPSLEAMATWPNNLMDWSLMCLLGPLLKERRMCAADMWFFPCFTINNITLKVFLS